MKRYFITLLIITLTLFGCTSEESTETQISTQIYHPSSTPILSTVTLAPTSTASPIPTVPPTRSPTLTPVEARDAIKTLLEKPVDCAAPCFWNITPGQSTLGDAISAITHFGLQLLYVNTLENKDFRQADYELDSGLSVGVNLTFQNNVVENLRVFIHPEKQKAGASREWLAYSPQTLIDRYGLPSRVDFFADKGGGSPIYAMSMYFDSVDLIAEYDSPDLDTQMQVCPLVNQIEYVRIWMGQDPQYPPLEGVPLEEATNMTMEEFAKAMTGDPNNACFELKPDMFP